MDVFADKSNASEYVAYPHNIRAAFSGDGRFIANRYAIWMVRGSMMRRCVRLQAPDPARGDLFRRSIIAWYWIEKTDSFLCIDEERRFALVKLDRLGGDQPDGGMPDADSMLTVELTGKLESKLAGDIKEGERVRLESTTTVGKWLLVKNAATEKCYFLDCEAAFGGELK